MTVDILFSGSRGNCTLIRHGGNAILIDCGKSARAVTKALCEVGAFPADIDAVFVTHEHSDHTSALEILCSANQIPIHMTEKSGVKIHPDNRAYDLVISHDVEYTERVGSLTVKSFPLPHDSLCHVGYVVSDSNGDVFGLATDIGHVTTRLVEELSRCRRVVVESNHDVEMLLEGSYPADLKRRILSKRGHLSNEDCGSLSCVLAEAGCEVFALAHLSPENNTPEVAYTEVRRALDSAGFLSAEVIVTDRHQPVHLPDHCYSEAN